MCVPGRSSPCPSRRNRLRIGRRDLNQRRSASGSGSRRKAEKRRARIAVTIDSQRILLVHLSSDGKSQTIERTLIGWQLLVSRLQHATQSAARKIGGHILPPNSRKDVGCSSHLRRTQGKRLAAADQYGAVAGRQCNPVVLG